MLYLVNVTYTQSLSQSLSHFLTHSVTNAHTHVLTHAHTPARTHRHVRAHYGFVGYCRLINWNMTVFCCNMNWLQMGNSSGNWTCS